MSPHPPLPTATAGARMEVMLNVTDTPGKMGMVMCGVWSGPAMLGDVVAGWELRTGRGH